MTKTKGTTTSSKPKVPPIVGVSKRKYCKKQQKSGMNTGRWERHECIAFMEGFCKFGRGKWKQIASGIPTRTTIQVKTHAQMVLKRLETDGVNDIFAIPDKPSSSPPPNDNVAVKNGDGDEQDNETVATAGSSTAGDLSPNHQWRDGSFDSETVPPPQPPPPPMMILDSCQMTTGAVPSPSPAPVPNPRPSPDGDDTTTVAFTTILNEKDAANILVGLSCSNPPKSACQFVSTKRSSWSSSLFAKDDGPSSNLSSHKYAEV